MKKVCIVGYGAIGPIHAMALEKTTQGRLYGVCDIDPARRRACRERYGAVEYDDFDAMIRDDEIQSIHICTPHYLHFEMIKKALAAGKDVVAEKPLVRTRQEWEELRRLPGADRICVVLQNRLNPCVQRMRELVRSGELGAVKAVRGILTWNRDEAYYRSADWRGKWETEGGGLLINQAVHTLDFFSYVVGDVCSVRADMCNHTLEGVIEVEDALVAHLKLRCPSGGPSERDKSVKQNPCDFGLSSRQEQGGSAKDKGFGRGIAEIGKDKEQVRGVFFATNGYGENSSPLFEISLEKGVARYMDQKLWINGELAAEDVPAAAGKDYWGSGHERLIQRYYDEGFHFSAKDAANTMETMFAIYEDAARGGFGTEKGVLRN